jgi:hypothetical protein
MIALTVRGLGTLTAWLRAVLRRSHVHLTQHTGRCGLAAID